MSDSLGGSWGGWLKDPNRVPLIMGLLGGLGGLGAGMARGGGAAGAMTAQGIMGGMQQGQQFGEMQQDQMIRGALSAPDGAALTPQQQAIRDALPAQMRQLAPVLGPQGTRQALMAIMSREQPETWRELTPDEARGMAPGTYERSNRGQTRQVSKPPDWMNPEYQAFRRDLAARSAPRTQVTLQNLTEREAVKADAEVLRDYNRTLINGQQLRAALDGLDQLNMTVPEGQGAQWAPLAAQWGRTFGIDVPGGSEAEQYQAIASRIQGLMRVPGTGDMNMREFQAVVNQIPQLSQTREGRARITQSLRGMLENQERAAQVWRQNLGAPDMYDRLRAAQPPAPTVVQPPPTTAGPQAPPVNPAAAAAAAAGGLLDRAQPPPAAAAPVRVRTPEEARQLPPGTPIILPDGRRGVVPQR